MSIIIKTVNELNARSAELHKTTRDVAKDIQAHLVDLMKYTAAKRDCTPAFKFLSMMEGQKDGRKYSIVRSACIKKWLEEYAFCVPGKSAKGNPTYKLATKRLESLDSKALLAHFKAAEKADWWKMEEEKEEKPIDLDKLIAALIKRVESKLDDNEVPEEVKAKYNVDQAKLEALKALVAA